MAFLRVEEVKVFHQQGLAVGGGAAGILDERKLISAVESVRNGYYDSVAAIAAAYGFQIANAHAFIDGNKRAAYLACWHFVRMNVFEPTPVIRPPGLEQAIILVASGAATEERLKAAIISALGGEDIRVE